MLFSPPEVDMVNPIEQLLLQLEYLYKKMCPVCKHCKCCLFVTEKLIVCLKILRQCLLVHLMKPNKPTDKQTNLIQINSN